MEKRKIGVEQQGGWGNPLGFRNKMGKVKYSMGLASGIGLEKGCEKKHWGGASNWFLIWGIMWKHIEFSRNRLGESKLKRGNT